MFPTQLVAAKRPLTTAGCFCSKSIKFRLAWLTSARDRVGCLPWSAAPPLAFCFARTARAMSCCSTYMRHLEAELGRLLPAYHPAPALELHIYILRVCACLACLQAAPPHHREAFTGDPRASGRGIPRRFGGPLPRPRSASRHPPTACTAHMRSETRAPAHLAASHASRRLELRKDFVGCLAVTSEYRKEERCSVCLCLQMGVHCVDG